MFITDHDLFERAFHILNNTGRKLPLENEDDVNAVLEWLMDIASELNEELFEDFQ